MELIRRFFDCSSGTVAVITAITLPVLLGMVGLGVEVGHWYLAEREMQGSADAGAISAAAQYIQDQIAGNTTSTTYKIVGANYVGYNGYTISNAHVCLITAAGDDCDLVRALDTRPIICSAPPCIMVEVTQNTANWLSTKASFEPGESGTIIKPIPAPTLLARSIVSVKLALTSTTTGNTCIIATANDRNAVQVRGNGDIHANCGLEIDGGRDQNARTPAIDTTPLCSDGTTPPCAGLTLSGSNAMVHITNLTVSASTAGPTGSSCPDPVRCFLYNPTTTTLPATGVFKNTATPDPFATRIFTKPAGQVATGAVLTTAGTSYTRGTRTFIVQGGTGIPAKFTATVSNSGLITGTPVLVDPGQYTGVPANPVSVEADDGKGTGGKFTLTFGNCLPNSAFPAVPVPGRAYCSINPVIGAHATLNFPTGIYYIEGGETGCVGFCLNAGNFTSDTAGVTFVLTNTNAGTTYAQYLIAGNNTVNFSAPANNINPDGSACSSHCTNTTFGMIVFQDRNAPISTALSSGGAVTSSNPAAGSTLNGMAGCGGNTCRSLSGSIYLPNQTASFSGNGQVQGTCFGIVAKYIDDAGVPIFQNGCLPGTIGGGGTGSVTGGNLTLAQ